MKFLWNPDAPVPVLINPDAHGGGYATWLDENGREAPAPEGRKGEKPKVILHAHYDQSGQLTYKMGRPPHEGAEHDLQRYGGHFGQEVRTKSNEPLLVPGFDGGYNNLDNGTGQRFELRPGPGMEPGWIPGNVTQNDAVGQTDTNARHNIAAANADAIEEDHETA